MENIDEVYMLEVLIEALGIALETIADEKKREYIKRALEDFKYQKEEYD